MSTDFVSPREIVVASDLTDTDLLLPHAMAQAQATGAKVTIVHAVGNMSRGFSVLDPCRDEMLIAQGILHQMADSLKSAGIECSVVAKSGLAAELVREEIRRTGAGRLIIGTHSHGPAGSAMIGSVANALLQTADIPVFVVGPELRDSANHARPRRILHPVALSGQYQESAELASEIAAFYQATLTLLHLMNPAASTGLYAERIAAKERSELDALRSSLTSHPDVVVSYGEVVPEILSTSATERSDWIIMGYSHDFPWWSMENNHAYRVIANSRCPVLILHSRIFARIRERLEMTAGSA